MHCWSLSVRLFVCLSVSLSVSSRLVVLESRLGLESRFKSIFAGLGLEQKGLGLETGGLGLGLWKICNQV